MASLSMALVLTSGEAGASLAGHGGGLEVTRATRREVNALVIFQDQLAG